MTPLTLNLLKEEQQAEEASARDPVKIAIFLGVLILTLTAGGGVWMTLSADETKREANQLQKRWDEMTAQQSGGSFRALKGFAEDLVRAHQQRMLLAPQTARIKDLVPKTIYLIRMGFKVTTEVGAVTPSAVEGGTSRPVRGQNVERLTLRLEGTAIGARPEIEVYDFLQTLRTDAVLSNQVKEIALRSVGRGAAEGVPTAQFVIECLYKEKR